MRADGLSRLWAAFSVPFVFCFGVVFSKFPSLTNRISRLLNTHCYLVTPVEPLWQFKAK